MSFLYYYFPITFVVCLVLQVVHEDSAPLVLQRALKNVGLLTLVLLAGSIVVYWISERLAKTPSLLDWAVFVLMAGGLLYWGWASGRKEKQKKAEGSKQ